MGNFRALAGAAESILGVLEAGFDDAVGGASAEDLIGASIDFVRLSGRDLQFPEDVAQNAPVRVGLFLYRVAINPNRRNSRVREDAGTRSGVPLVVDLHYLLTVITDNAEFEQVALGRALDILHQNPILSGERLVPSGAWGADERLQLSIGGLSDAEAFEFWEAQGSGYRTAVPIIARAVSISLLTEGPAADVVEADITYAQAAAREAL